MHLLDEPDTDAMEERMNDALRRPLTAYEHDFLLHALTRDEHSYFLLSGEDAYEAEAMGWL